MCVKTLPIIQDEASSSAPREFADVAPDNSIPEINKIHKNKTSFMYFPLPRMAIHTLQFNYLSRVKSLKGEKLANYGGTKTILYM